MTPYVLSLLDHLHQVIDTVPEEHQGRFIPELIRAEGALHRLRMDIEADYPPAPILCPYRGKLVDKGSCTCGAGDVFECLHPSAQIDGAPGRTRRKDCGKCKHNDAVNHETASINTD